MYTQTFNKMEHAGNNCQLSKGCSLSEASPEHRLHVLQFMVVFLSSSRQILRGCSNCFNPHPLQLIIIHNKHRNLCMYIYILQPSNVTSNIQDDPRRNVPYFGRMFLTLKYTDITQNTYVYPKLNGYGDNDERSLKV